MDVASLRVKVVNEGMDAATKGLDEVTKSADKAEKSVGKLEKAEKKIKKFNDNLSGLRNAALGMGAALGGVLYKSIGAAQEFESAMADVKKVVNFDTPDGFANMRNDLLEMSKEIPIAADGLAQIAAAAGQSGIAANEIARFTESAAKMGTAFDISADQAGQAMAEMRVAFGYSQDEVETLADKINYLGNTTPNAAAKLTTVVQRIGSLGKISGVSADQLAAMGASITSLEPEVVATGLKNMMINMTRGAAATKPMRAAWQDLGFTAEEVAKGMQEDSRAMIDSVLGAINKLPKEEQTSYINTIFGTEALPVVAQLATNTEALTTNLNAMGDASKYAGSMQAEYQTRSETTANQMELLKNNLTAAAVAVGDALLPAFNSLLETVTPVIEKFSDWASENPETVKGIITAAAAVTGLVLSVSGLGLAFGNIISVFKGVKTTFSLVKLGIGLLTNPLGLAVLAIGALVTAGVLLYQNWDTVKAKAQELYEKVKGVFESLPSPVKTAMELIWGNIKASFEIIKTIFQTGWDVVKAIFTGNWSEIPSIVGTGIEKVKSIIGERFEAVKSIVSDVWQSIKDKISNKWQEIKDDAISYLDVLLIVLKGKFNEMKHNAKQKMVEIKNAIVSSLKSLPEKMRKMASDAVAGLVNGLKAKIGQVKQAAVDLGKAAWGGVKDFLHIRSPSRKMAELGKHTADGMAKGIKDNAKVVKTEAQKMADQAVETVKNSIASLKKEIALFGNDSPLASFQYDVSVGKYAGVPQSMLEQNAELIRQKQQLIKLDQEAKDAADALAKEQQRIAQANQSVLDSVAGINRQIALFNGNDALSGLMYDIENTGKYADVSAENMQKLIDKTKELQLLKDTKSANDAFYNMTDSMQEDSPMGRLIAERDERLAILAEANRYEIGMAQERTNALLAIEQSFMDKKRDLLLTQSQNLFSGLSGLAKSFAGEQSGIYRTLFAIEKGFAIAQSAIAIQQSIAKAMAVGFPQNLPLIGQAVSQGGQIMSAIRSVTMPVGQAHDGIMSVPKSGTWNLEKGERVLPAHTAKAMDRKLEAVNDAPNVNITVNVDANSNAQMNAKQADNMSRRMAESIKAVVVDTLRKEKRQGGMLYA